MQFDSALYNELRRLARRHLRRERPDHTLQPTALVNEAFLRLNGRSFNDRVHFCASASVVMRHILVDHAKKRAAAKSPGGKKKLELDDFLASVSPRLDDMLILDEALTRLAAMAPRQAGLVELIYFGGLTIKEAAKVLGISERTAKRDWDAARAWLHAQLSKKKA